MGVRLPRVCIFGAENIVLRSAVTADVSETTELECHCFADDGNLQQILISLDPHVIITAGRVDAYPQLLAAPFEVRRRWLNFPDFGDLDRVGSDAFHCYIAVCLDQREEEPLVSIFTPAYRTGKRFIRAYNSVAAQTYRNWEWVILDDSDDDGATAAMIQSHAENEPRIKLIKRGHHSGVIGEVKYAVCMATRGKILVELDHDDELTPSALAYLISAYRKYPQCGFYYSDNAEVTTDLSPLGYPDGWGWGYGSYREEVYRGKKLLVTNSPNINAKTIRGLVAAPNHLRAWRRDLYMQLGGHNRLLHVADDMDLLIRTFLATTMLRIPKLCYLQYQEGENTQRIRNKDIQRHVRYLKARYDRQIHDRFVALNVDDWIWNEKEGYADFRVSNPTIEPTASLVADL